MSGALAAMAGSGNSSTTSITVAAINERTDPEFTGAMMTFGYALPAYLIGGLPKGAASPTTAANVLIGKACSCDDGTFELILVSTLAQSYIREVILQRTSGVLAKLPSSAATFSSSTWGGASRWRWTDTGWTSTTSPRFILVRY